MSDEVRNALKRVVADCGRDVVHDAKRCDAMLRDLAPADRSRDINVLVSALREKAVDELLASDALPIATRLDRAVERFQAATGITETLARWGIESWALVLGVVTQQQLSELRPSRSLVIIEKLGALLKLFLGFLSLFPLAPPYPNESLAYNIGYVLGEVGKVVLLYGLVGYLSVSALTFLVGWMIWGYLGWIIKAGGVIFMLGMILAFLENKMPSDQSPESKSHNSKGGVAALIGTLLLVIHASEFDQIWAWISLVTICTLAGGAGRLTNRWLVIGVVFLISTLAFVMLLANSNTPPATDITKNGIMINGTSMPKLSGGSVTPIEPSTSSKPNEANKPILGRWVHQRTTGSEIEFTPGGKLLIHELGKDRDNFTYGFNGRTGTYQFDGRILTISFSDEEGKEELDVELTVDGGMILAGRQTKSYLLRRLIRSLEGKWAHSTSQTSDKKKK